MPGQIDLKLDLKNIEDVSIREAFFRIQEYIRRNALFFNFKYLTTTFISAVTEERFYHKLDFLPMDIVLTFNDSTSVVTFHYTKFTKDYLVISTTGPCKIRFLAGRFSEGDYAG